MFGTLPGGRAKKLEKETQAARGREETSASHSAENRARRSHADKDTGWHCAVWTVLDQQALGRLVDACARELVVTRQFDDGRFAAAVALVDRTALGAKDGFVRGPLTRRELNDFILEIGEPHVGMHPCDLLVAQSVVFHAIEYARKLGIEPHPDFPANLYGARPEVSIATPWHPVEKPIYIMGPAETTESFRR